MNNPNEKAVAALATDAPIVEGLDEALDRNRRALLSMETNVYGDDPTAAIARDWKIITDAARLYAQGRTQRAPEGWKLVPVKHPVTSEMKAACIGEFSFKIADICAECYEEENKNCELCHGEVDYHREITVPWDTCKAIYKAMLSAAPQFKPRLATLLNEPSILEAVPPVTGGAKAAPNLKHKYLIDALEDVVMRDNMPPTGSGKPDCKKCKGKGWRMMDMDTADPCPCVSAPPSSAEKEGV